MDLSSGYCAADIGVDITVAQRPLRLSPTFWSGLTQQKRPELVAKLVGVQAARDGA